MYRALTVKRQVFTSVPNIDTNKIIEKISSTKRKAGTKTQIQLLFTKQPIRYISFLEFMRNEV